MKSALLTVYPPFGRQDLADKDGTMEGLRTQDLRALLDFLAGIDGMPDAATLAQRVMVSLPALVPSDLTVWSEMDPSGRQFRWAHDADHFEFSGISRIFERNMRRHPLVTHFRRTGDGRAFKLSDFVTRRQLHRQPFYDEIYRPLGCEHEIAFWLGGASQPVTAFALHRACRDFSERERLLLNLVRAHLAEIRRTLIEVHRAKHQIAALHQGLDVLDEGIVVLGNDGRVLHATRRARAWFAEYFPSAGPSGCLPGLVRDWLQRQAHARGANGHVPAPPGPLVVERDGKRLAVRLCAEPPHGLLLLEERSHGAAPVALEPLGLSRREAETLTWVTAGKTNREIGATLGISPRTVQTHLDRIYRKLGVDTRAAAVACALTARR
jgi:DNA-binding CsgD family transcriptional regulator